MNIFEKFRKTLQKTRQSISEKVSSILAGRSSVDESSLEALEEALIAADVGPVTSMKLIDGVRKSIREGRSSGQAVSAILQQSIEKLLEGASGTIVDPGTKPFCILVVGVNGVGKTTTIAKLAHMFKSEGKRVVLAAGDTFRAAAIEQIEAWARRVGCEIVKHREGSDPAAVVYDALSAAKARDADVVIADTAGRLHTKVNLMNELGKIRRVMSKEVPGAPHETLLVLDANTGQNALQQARVFKEATDVTGIVITKLDGTAKGGVVLSIAAELGIPVKFITTGETVEDIAPFDARAFAEAMLK